MDKEMSKDWDEAITKLMGMDSDKRKHFALLIVSLAKCYTEQDKWKAVILIENDDALLTFSAGADEYEASNMVSKAYEVMGLVATADAPDREMFN
jgi:outer membrane protein assembly factor BamD (BamD/ComL family)